MAKVFLVCVAAFLICSLLSESINAKYISYPDLKGDTTPCKRGRNNCNPRPANQVHKACIKIERCRGGSLRKLLQQVVDSEDKEEEQYLESMAPRSPTEPLEERYNRDTELLGH
ncbi:hypothetical protein ACHQM5_003349 [Ranunculus cassubicifolius]